MVAVLLGATLLTACEDKSPIPVAPRTWATDTVDFLPRQTVMSLDSRLRNYQTTTRHSLLVWVGELPVGSDADTYSTVLFNEWTVGRKHHDDGVVLFVYPNAHQYRIRVGLGLETTIPDAEAVRIGQEIITPNFKLADEARIASSLNYHRSLAVNLAMMVIMHLIDTREGR